MQPCEVWITTDWDKDRRMFGHFPCLDAAVEALRMFSKLTTEKYLTIEIKLAG
jgi:hypothetical protein